jgi:hypothetical protein
MIKEELKNYVGADLLFAQMDELKTIREENKKLLEALTALFENCVMIHKSWGDGDNTIAANEAVNKARAAIQKAVAE